ncbi:MAG: DUF805 domain-containing protein, partial [Ignavibacteria bacterium]
ANDFSGASATNPTGYRLGMWIFSILGFLGLFFAFMLRRNEMGPNAHGLELSASNLGKIFENPFSFKGRIRRTEYGLSFIIYSIFAIILNLLIQSGGGYLFFLLVYIPLFWFIWAQGTKRCHDRGCSGAYQFIPFYIFWLLFADSDTGTNEYGSNPKDDEKK